MTERLIIIHPSMSSDDKTTATFYRRRGTNGLVKYRVERCTATDMTSQLGWLKLIRDYCPDAEILIEENGIGSVLLDMFNALPSREAA
jgi:hypothetical protein